MKPFIKNYTDWILGFIGLVMGAILLYVFFWGAVLIVRNMDSAFGSSDGFNREPKFELEKARQLDYRGLNKTE